VWRPRAALAVPLAVVLALALAACGGGDEVEGPPPVAPDRLELTSSAFPAGGRIPVRFTCDGEEVAPPLAWRGVPGRARSLALLMEDPDAPGGTFVHWTLFDIPPDARGLAAGRTPGGARAGENSFGDAGYGGPCPPEGDAPHRYVLPREHARS
jgi:Raf kinase inhibitor-like YbhB/YbcL family protein